MSLFTGTLRDEPANEYHAKRDYVSSSPLAKMALSPLHFYTAWTGESESTDPMERGNFIHKILLEQDIAKYVARPMKDGRLVASNTKEYLAWAAQHADQTPIHPDLHAEAATILGSACKSGTFLKAFETSDKEVSFYAKHATTDLPIKARPDMVARDFSFILDVKSTADIARFERQIFGLSYDTRLMHYAQTVMAVTGCQMPEFYFFAIESKAPFATRMFRLSVEAVQSALLQWEEWMNVISVCKTENRWPGFDDTITDVSRPAYLEVETVQF